MFPAQSHEAVREPERDVHADLSLATRVHLLLPREKLAPEKLFMFVGSFQRWLPLLALDCSHAQNVRSNNGTKQCQTQLKDPDGRSLPSVYAKKVQNYHPSFKSQLKCHFLCKAIARPQSELIVSIASNTSSAR